MQLPELSRENEDLNLEDLEFKNPYMGKGKERYVLDHGVKDELVAYVDRKNNRIKLVREYYSLKSSKKVRSIRLSIFKRLARQVLYFKDCNDVEEFYKEDGRSPTPTKEELELVEKTNKERSRNPTWLRTGRHG